MLCRGPNLEGAEYKLSLSLQKGHASRSLNHFPCSLLICAHIVLSCALCCGHNPLEEQVMSLDFHPVHNSLLAVGCHDGTVMVFDVRHKANRPIYSSSIKTGKHTDPVWQVSRRARRQA